MQFKVRVLDEDGDAVVGKEVTVLFTSMFRGSLEEYTDDEGQADFDYNKVKPGEAKIYVDGVAYGPYYIEDGDGYTVNLDSNDDDDG